MPCYHPIAGWYAVRRNKSGKRSIVFGNSNPALVPDYRRPVQVPCGKCVGCRLEYSRQWAVRCMHESKLHACSVFVTLTYDDVHVPRDGNLRPRDYVLFMKRLRLAHPGVRFFQCGEYGDLLGRPHHHAVLFNCWFPDQRFLKEKTPGCKLYTSAELDRLWGQGQCTFGAVTFESAAYVARYAMKKIGGPKHGRVPEYCTMSRRPGIGSDFVHKFRSDIYPSDSVIVRGVQCRPPRYYDVKLDSVAPSVLLRVKARRRRLMNDKLCKIGVDSEYGVAVAGEAVNSRLLSVSEVVKQSAISTLSREVDSNG